MALDMVHVDGFGDTGYLVNVSCKVPDIRIVDDTPEIAFEVREIHRIEPHERGKQPYIGFGQFVTRQISGAGQDLLHAIERVEQFLECTTVSSLFARESATVNTVIDTRV